MKKETIKFICPHCSEEINKLNYEAKVDEWGRVSIYLNKTTGKIEEGSQDMSDSDTTESITKCPSCEHTLEAKDIIIEGFTKEKIKYKIGDKIIFTEDTCNHQFKIGTKAIIIEIEQNFDEIHLFKEKKGSPKGRSYFTQKDIKLINPKEEIDKGQSEGFEMIINKEDKEEYKIDPMLKDGSICPSCKKYFADPQDPNRWEDRNIIDLKIENGKFINKNKKLSICPFCSHEFDKAKEFNKLIKKEKCQN